jgi:hypothetical protein
LEELDVKLSLRIRNGRYPYEITNDSSAFLIVHNIHIFHDNFFLHSSMRISFHVVSFYICCLLRETEPE